MAVIEAPLLKELAGDETQRGWLCSASGIPSHRPAMLVLLGVGGLTLLAQEFPLLMGAGSPLGTGLIQLYWQSLCTAEQLKCRPAVGACPNLCWQVDKASAEQS